ncbi:MAG: hypothetical protein M1343_02865 [Chloroflexi bacterium]|nr:hypothetical protein [Chloroflexota bacterium]MDA8187216.1 hypothetical protein [Dehalococcoidales bacterium]
MKQNEGAFYSRGSISQPVPEWQLLLDRGLRHRELAGAEINRYSQIVADICLRHDLLIGTVPVAEGWFRRQVEPLYENVMGEGVAV